MLVWNAVIGAVFHADIYSHDNQQGSLTGTLAVPHFLLWVVKYLSCCIIFMPTIFRMNGWSYSQINNGKLVGRSGGACAMYMYNVHSSLQFVS